MTQPRITTNAAQFAARGDLWNARNEQHHAIANPWRRRRHPDGTMELVEDHRDVDGYDPVHPAAAPMTARPKPRYVDPAPTPVDPTLRHQFNAERREWLKEQALRRPVRNVFK
jgi:hypothetical protein